MINDEYLADKLLTAIIFPTDERMALAEDWTNTVDTPLVLPWSKLDMSLSVFKALVWEEIDTSPGVAVAMARMLTTLYMSCGVDTCIEDTESMIVVLT